MQKEEILAAWEKRYTYTMYDSQFEAVDKIVAWHSNLSRNVKTVINMRFTGQSTLWKLLKFAYPDYVKLVAYTMQEARRNSFADSLSITSSAETLKCSIKDRLVIVDLNGRPIPFNAYTRLVNAKPVGVIVS